MKTVHERIQKVRFDIRLSQKEFAEEIGVHRGHISNIETGKINPSKKLIERICVAFKVDRDWLVEGKGYMRRELQDFQIEEEEELEESEERRIKNLVKEVEYDELISRVNAAYDALFFAKHKIKAQFPNESTLDGIDSNDKEHYLLFLATYNLMDEYEELIDVIARVTEGVIIEPRKPDPEIKKYLEELRSKLDPDYTPDPDQMT